MNLETLLEAAKYVEYSSKVKARGEEPEDYDTFERQCACDDQLITRLHQKSHIKSDSDTPKEKRRLSGVLASKEVPVFSDEAQGIGTREVHNKLEKNRRAHLKQCFENLKRQLPSMDERKTSNLSILRGALRYIQTLKRREREYEHEMERLAREKIAAQRKLVALKKELSTHLDHVDVNLLASEGDSETTTTASECGHLSDIDDDDDVQHEMSSTSLQHNSSSSEVTSPTSSTISNAATSDSITGTNIMGSLFADDTLRLSKSTRTSFSSEELTSLSSSMVTSPSPLASLAAVSATCLSMTHSMSKLQASVAVPSLAPESSILHGTSSISQPAHASLSSQVTGSQSFQVNTMTGMLTSPRTVQVITQHGEVKVITTPNAIASGTPVCNSVTAAPIQNGSLHILTSSASLMALGAPSAVGAANVVTASSKTSGTQSLVHVAPLSTVNSTKHLMSPVTLVTPHGVVGVTQVTTAPKSIVINQVASLSASSSVTTVANSVTVESKTMTAPSSALCSKRNILTGVTAAVATQPNIVTPLQTSHIVQSGITPRSNATPQVLSTSVLASQVNNMGHQIVTASIESVSPVAHSPASRLPGIAHMTHVMSQAPAASSVGHIVPAGNHVSAMTPLMAPMSMVSHSAPAHHPQVYTAQSQQLGKTITSPVLKPVGQIPIMQQQLLQPTVGAQPVVVVSMAPASNGPPVPVVVTSTNKQVGTISVKVTQ